MPIGDKQYDISWAEQDKIRRRLEIKHRLKAEGVRRRYDPFLQMKCELYQDPALDRYMDLRKRGRLPNTPLKPAIFFYMVGMLTVPVFILNWAIQSERTPYLERCASGDYPYEDRDGKTMGI